MKRLISGAVLALALGSAMPAAAAQTDNAKAGVEAWGHGDYRTAVTIWRKLANAGDADAQFNLGQAYTLGNGVPKDEPMALSWFGKAAAQGHAEGETNYGIALFRAGRRDEAKPWLEKGVARGDPRAQLIYGTMLYNGDGVPRDAIRGYALIVRSSASGLPQAATVQAQMDKNVSETDRRAGLELAKKYEAEQQRPALPPEIVQAGQPGGKAPVVASMPPPPKSIAPPQVRGPVGKAPSAAPPPQSQPRPAIAAGGWKLQLGAFGDPANARKLWSEVSGHFPGRQPSYVKAGALTRLLVGPFTSRGEAGAACGSVKPCVPVGP